MVVVTGAARGIGLATSDLFVSKGWYVTMIDRDAEELKKVTEERKGKPIKVPSITPQTELEKKRYEAALRRRQLSLVLAGKMKPSEATELKAIFD